MVCAKTLVVNKCDLRKQLAYKGDQIWQDIIHCVEITVLVVT